MITHIQLDGTSTTTDLLGESNTQYATNLIAPADSVAFKSFLRCGNHPDPLVSCWSPTENPPAEQNLARDVPPADSPLLSPAPATAQDVLHSDFVQHVGEHENAAKPTAGISIDMGSGFDEQIGQLQQNVPSEELHPERDSHQSRENRNPNLGHSSPDAPESPDASESAASPVETRIAGLSLESLRSQSDVKHESTPTPPHSILEELRVDDQVTASAQLERDGLQPNDAPLENNTHPEPSARLNEHPDRIEVATPINQPNTDLGRRVIDAVPPVLVGLLGQQTLRDSPVPISKDASVIGSLSVGPDSTDLRDSVGTQIVDNHPSQMRLESGEPFDLDHPLKEGLVHQADLNQWLNGAQSPESQSNTRSPIELIDSGKSVPDQGPIRAVSTDTSQQPSADFVAQRTEIDASASAERNASERLNSTQATVNEPRHIPVSLESWLGSTADAAIPSINSETVKVELGTINTTGSNKFESPFVDLSVGTVDTTRTPDAGSPSDLSQPVETKPNVRPVETVTPDAKFTRRVSAAVVSQVDTSPETAAARSASDCESEGKVLKDEPTVKGAVLPRDTSTGTDSPPIGEVHRIETGNDLPSGEPTGERRLPIDTALDQKEMGKLGSTDSKKIAADPPLPRTVLQNASSFELATDRPETLVDRPVSPATPTPQSSDPIIETIRMVSAPRADVQPEIRKPNEKSLGPQQSSHAEEEMIVDQPELSIETEQSTPPKQGHSRRTSTTETNPIGDIESTPGVPTGSSEHRPEIEFAGVAEDIASTQVTTNRDSEQVVKPVTDSTPLSSHAIPEQTMQQIEELYLPGRSKQTTVVERSLPLRVSSVVSEMIQTDDVSGKKQVTIELKPASLGELKIQVEQSGQSIVTHIIASEFSSSELLNNQRDILLDALSDLGFESADVNISHQDDASSERSRWNHDESSTTTGSEVVHDDKPIPETGSNESGKLNLVA